jgi:hypothetical protein
MPCPGPQDFKFVARGGIIIIWPGYWQRRWCEQSRAHPVRQNKGSICEYPARAGEALSLRSYMHNIRFRLIAFIAFCTTYLASNVQGQTVVVQHFPERDAAAFSYWMAHPDAATHAIGAVGLPINLTLEPGHATAAMFGLSGDSMMDWAAAKVPFLQKEIPVEHD